ncbi:hypothetical protein A3G14_01325 [Candidatus Curtissbacteria bacterium RIFCSPLOWO2_12_FULL_38_9]|uniref:Glycosyltransferase RgtA/B/C/D-like domain-containing protein n=1 Tax=Candidatus Curtissbacteria bacterium RIFCSPLOWO2_12_FULL_38_9 TaxID=1797735 RepID=A0A1F5I7D9_9BACT|nr:MAG: hypothetical protein A3G14_01325 [Candidatus Curtissbacteria bacterium RIFCSPLOWO2_12_FULL_38_9]
MELIGKRTFILISYTFLTIGYAFSIGLYDFSSFWIITMVFAVLLVALFIKLPTVFIDKDDNIFIKFSSFLIILSIAITFYLPKEFYELNTILKPLQFYIFLVAFIISLSFLIDINYRLKKFRFFTLLSVPVISQILIIINTPYPKIDVFDILQNASSAVVQGINPYTITFNQIYENITPDYFTYMPFSFLMNIPARTLLGDVRFTSVVSLLITSFIIYKIGEKQNMKEDSYQNTVLLFMYHPLATLIVGEAWLDPILVALFSLFGYLFLTYKNKYWAYFTLALAFGVKQNMFLILPFLIKLKPFNFQKLILAYIPVIAVILFLLFLSPKDFIADTVKEPILRKTRFDALTFHSFIHNIYPSVQIPKGFFLLPIIFLPILLFKQGKKISSFYLTFAIWFLCSLILFREAFLNQYYFVSSLLILSLSFGSLRSKVRKIEKYH